MARPQDPGAEYREGIVGPANLPGRTCDRREISRERKMRLLILGAGGHGRVVADAAERSAAGWREIAFLDDRHPQLGVSGPWQVVGTFTDLERLAAGFDGCVPAVGDARLRLALLRRARAAGYEIPVVLHPQSAVSGHARLGA